MVVAISVSGFVKKTTQSKMAAIAVGFLAGLLASLFYLIGGVVFYPGGHLGIGRCDYRGIYG